MSSTSDDAATRGLSVLSRALDQTGMLIARVRPDQYAGPTPCADWKVEDLLRHVVAAPRNFIAMFSGEEVNWADPPELGDNPAGDFRDGSQALLEHLRRSGDAASPGPAIPEFAVHAWDLSRAIDDDTPLDDEVATEALSFMRANLGPEMREGVFDEEQPVDDQASAPDRLAAFAGRRP